MGGAKGGATYWASASVSKEADGIKLRAYAFAEAPPVITEETFLYAASAEARVRWYDTLTIANYDALPLAYRHDVRLTYFPLVEGNINSKDYTYQFSAGISDVAAAPPSVDRPNSLAITERRLAGILVDDRRVGSSPLYLYYNNAQNLASASIDLYMSLLLRVNSRPGDGGSSGPSEADFSHTLTIGPLVVSDSNGNYIPGSESLQIVGSSGLVYGVRTVPEPSTTSLAILGMLLCRLGSLSASRPARRRFAPGNREAFDRLPLTA